MSVHILNTVGLSLNIIGAVVLFFWAFPQPSFTVEGGGIGLEPNTPVGGGLTAAQLEAQQREQTCAKRARYSCTSLCGLGFVIAGWLFELWATWAA